MILDINTILDSSLSPDWYTGDSYSTGIDIAFHKQRQNGRLLQLQAMVKYKKQFEPFSSEEKYILDHYSPVKNIPFLFEEQHKIIVCKTPKAASTSMVWIFRKLYNVSDDLERMPAVRIMNNKLLKQRRNLRSMYNNILKREYTRIILVRHPFDRIVSAYRNKLENKNLSKSSKIYHGRLGTRIVKNFRFSNDSVEQSEATFQEVVRYILSSAPSKVDQHFQPITYYCNVWNYHYDIIMKKETFDFDLNYMLITTGIDVNIVGKLRANEGPKSSEDDVTLRYFSKLSHEEILQLYEYYKWDFKLFNYEYQKYIKIGN